MTTVFLGGSRAVSRLNPVIRAKLDDLINLFLVGDANGADKALQQYLSSRGYRNVGRILYGPLPQGSCMAEAKCGVMFWDGKSKGTLNSHRRSDLSPCAGVLVEAGWL